MFPVNKITKGCLIIGLGFSLMGNEGCKEQAAEPEARMLKRRVQMGQITAPDIELPAELGRRKFDWSYVANIQMYDILSKTQSFTTANIDPNEMFDPSGMDEDEKERFNSCDAEEEQQMQVFDFKTNAKLNGSANSSKISKSAACLIHWPQGIVSGDIIDFQFTNGLGVDLGLANIPFLEQLSFDMKKYTLSVQMKARSPLEIGNQQIATTIRKSYASQTSFSARINLGFLSLGPKYYFQSGLDKVVHEGFTNAVKDLRDEWNKNEDWYSMVFRSCDNYIYINAGYDANLKEGDIVAIRNVKYFWQGEVCKSKSYGEMPTAPVAYAKIMSVGRNISEAWIIKNDASMPQTGEKIYPGARVYLHKSLEQMAAKSTVAQKK